MRWEILLVCVLAIGCGDFTARQALEDDPACFQISPEFSDKEIEATLEAWEAWEPHPIQIDLSVGGNCRDKIKRADAPEFRGENQPYALTYKAVLANGDRGRTIIKLNPSIDFWEKSPCSFKLAVMHEIGHALGLEAEDHAPESERRVSVMASWPLCSATVTDADRAAVAELY